MDGKGLAGIRKVLYRTLVMADKWQPRGGRMAVMATWAWAAIGPTCGAFSFGSSGKSMGNWRVLALGLSEEAVELAAGGVEGALLVFPAVVDQRAAVLVDYITDELFGGNLP